MSITPSCEFCEKKGLPIFPARFAIAPINTRAPRAYGNMLPTGCGDTPISLGDHADYTVRMLRSGYLYLYNEALKRWSAWFVTEGGYFMPFEVQQCLAPGYLKGREPCSREGHREIASCITISSPKLATDVWLAFSDVQWTAAVLDRHNDAAYRARYMRKLNVPELLAGQLPAGEPVKKIAELGNTVAEYAGASVATAFAFSPASWQARAGQTEQVIAAAESLNPGKGVIVALHDPVGMAMDLSALMKHELNRFIMDSGYKHELATHDAIASLEHAVRNGAIAREDEAAEALADDMQAQPDVGMLFPGYRKDKLAQIESVRTVTEVEAKRVAEHAWAKYRTKFDEAAMASWKQAFDTRMAQFDTTHIVPLARAHVAWMKSNTMASAMACHYDERDADSGLAYALTVGMCLGGTQDKAACFDLYTNWLQGSPVDKRNLILRALVLNQQRTAEEINAATSVSLDWRAVPFNSIVDAFNQSTKTVLERSPDALGRVLVAPLLGPISKMLAEAADGKLRPAMVALGLHTQQPFFTVEIIGGKKQFRAALIRMLASNSGRVPNRHQMQRAVAAELRRLEASGVRLDGTQKKRFVLMVDPEQVDLPANASPQQRAHAMASRIITPEDVEALRYAHWQQKVRNPLASATKGALPYAAALIMSVLQYNVMQKLMEDDGKAMSHQQAEADMRMAAGVMAFGGGIAELTGMGLEKAAPLFARRARQIELLSTGAKFLGKGLGIAGGLVMAYWDLKASDAAETEGQYGLARMYTASAALGVGAALALMFGWTGVGLILVGLLISVTVLIEFFKDNKVQDWLERCAWGKGPGQRYPTVEVSMRELDLALQG